MRAEVIIEDGGVMGFFNALTEFGRSPVGALREIGAELKESTRLRFLASKAPDGSTWKALALATLLKRASRGRSMRRGGALVTKGGIFRAAFQRKIAAGGQPLMDTRTHLFNTIAYRVEGRDSVLVGAAPKWGMIHQRGGRAGRGHKVTIPARPIFGVSVQDRAAIVGILKTQVTAAMRAAAPGVGIA